MFSGLCFSELCFSVLCFLSCVFLSCCFSVLCFSPAHLRLVDELISCSLCSHLFLSVEGWVEDDEWVGGMEYA